MMILCVISRLNSCIIYLIEGTIFQWKTASSVCRTRLNIKNNVPNNAGRCYNIIAYYCELNSYALFHTCGVSMRVFLIHAGCFINPK